MVPVCKGVPSGQQPGIVFHAEQIQNRRQDVLRGAEGRNLDVHAGQIADKAVVIPLKDGVDLPTGQLVVLRLAQTVGVVIVRQDDQRPVRDPRLGEPLFQVGQGVLDLQIAGDEGLDRVGIRQSLHRVAVPGAHVVFPIVLVVPAHGHIVGVEGRPAFQIIVHGGVDHLPV